MDPAVLSRSYGTIKLSNNRKLWLVDCEPQVAIRAKRVFGGAAKTTRGQLTITANDGCARDLAWLLTRYPMEVLDLDELEASARRFDDHLARTHRVISGAYEAPQYTMALPPRPYQHQAAALVWTSRGTIVADELGLGKTVVGLTVLSNPDCLPAVVVCPTHIQDQWKREAERFLPALRVHIVKKIADYDLGEQDIIIITYHKLWAWADRLVPSFRTVIFDEVQELRKRDSRKYEAAHSLAFPMAYRLGLSATPIHNLGSEFFAVLDCIAPDVLGSREEFLREWCGSSDGRGNACVADPKAFGAYLREMGRFIRRTKAEVGRELPPLNIITHEVECDPERLDDVKSSATELARIIVGNNGNRGFDILKASQQFSMQLRHATGVAKAPYVADFVRMLLETSDEPLILAGWHHDVYAIWAELLAEFDPVFYTGQQSPAQKKRNAQRFVDGETRLLIMSLRSGAGLDGLQHNCSRALVGELDWSPTPHEQFFGRVYRDGQTEPVFAYYLVANDGSDPVVADTLGLKRAQLDGVRRNTEECVGATRVDPGHVQRLATDYLKRHGGKS